MKPGKLLGYFVISNNPELYRGVSCFLKQVGNILLWVEIIFLVLGCTACIWYPWLFNQERPHSYRWRNQVLNLPEVRSGL